MSPSSRCATWAKRLAAAAVFFLTVAIMIVVGFAGVVLGGPPVPRP